MINNNNVSSWVFLFFVRLRISVIIVWWVKVKQFLLLKKTKKDGASKNFYTKPYFNKIDLDFIIIIVIQKDKLYRN